MEITDYDKLFYTSAVEYLYNKFEIAGEFVRNNGLTSIPVEELTDMMIISMKEWLGSDEGESWLNTLGYYKTSMSSMTFSGCASVYLDSTELCPVCSGNFIATHGNVCERCGGIICGPCVSIVDKDYGVLWCDSCIQSEGLTNILIYGE